MKVLDHNNEKSNYTPLCALAGAQVRIGFGVCWIHGIFTPELYNFDTQNQCAESGTRPRYGFVHVRMVGFFCVMA